VARELFRIPLIDLPIYGYGAMVLLGFLAGYFFVLRGAQRDGIEREKVQDLPIWMVFSGLLGARLFYFMQFYSTDFSDGRWWHVFKIWEGGLVFYGGLILGAVTFLIYCRRLKLPILPMLDLMAPATALGLGFGRIGCFLNGCCWGKACDASFTFAVRFPAGSPPASLDAPSPWIHPAQLYSSLNAFLLGLLLWAVWRRKPAPGTVIGLLFLLYGVSRFLLEGIRGDHGVAQGAWTVSQSVSSAGIVLGVILLIGAKIVANSQRNLGGGASNNRA